MKKQENKETRYYMDVDLMEQKIVGWDFAQREVLHKEELANPCLHRIFLTKGQYNKLNKKQKLVESMRGGGGC